MLSLINDDEQVSTIFKVQFFKMFISVEQQQIIVGKRLHWESIQPQNIRHFYPFNLINQLKFIPNAFIHLNGTVFISA